VKEKHDAVVVGGGIAGLVATVFLAREGLDVLLLERSERCGGLVNTFVRDGFRFEVGVRALISAGTIFPMLDELDITLEALPNRVSVGIEDRIMQRCSIARGWWRRRGGASPCSPSCPMAAPILTR